jgi:pimeloyl-ACP methyl ester carboxylesterase
MPRTADSPQESPRDQRHHRDGGCALTPHPQSRTVRTDDGRDLEVFVAGPEKGMPLIFHVGTPAAAAPFPLAEDIAAAHGLRTVLYSRPGYGASTRHPGRRAADSATDARAVLDALGADDFVTIGWSGGGPHALACGALLPQRCRAVATLGGVAPNDRGFHWAEGMGTANVDAFLLGVEGGDAYERNLHNGVAILRSVQAHQLEEQFASLLTAPDRHALHGPIAEFIAEGYRRATAQDIAGWYDDEASMLRTGWGFDLADVSVPVEVWQGKHDLMTPPAHANWLCAHLPNARLRLVETEGHVSLVANRLDQVIASIAGPPAD